MSTLVTGGAGYIGAHVVRLLGEQGRDVVVVDDLSSGDVSRIGATPLVHLDIASSAASGVLEQVMRERRVTEVVHFAARKQVGESVAHPAWYYQQNVGGMANLLTAMESAEVDALVFSSSAAVYGEPEVGTVTEQTRLEPINPYGETKVVGEWMGRAATRAWGLRFVALRYFNVAGAGWPELGDSAIQNLVPMVFDKIARGERPAVFGADYPTPDGTCVRDYIHVLDLARAHLAAIDYLRLPSNERPHDAFNVGTGRGASVREVVEQIGRTSGLDVTPDVHPRRPGDPAALVGSPGRIESALGWRATAGLEEIVSSAWNAWQARDDRARASQEQPGA